MTRLEVFNKCAYLWCKVKSIDSINAEAKKYRQQNAKIREESANMERDFINEVSKLAHEMEDSKKRFTEKITERDNKIASMKIEIKMLKKKLVDSSPIRSTIV